MPWSTPVVSELRTAFVHAVRTAGRPVAQAARDFEISRKTAYKWLARFDQQRPLSDASRKPHRSPHRTSEALECAVLAVRDQYGWGPRKIHAFLTNNHQPAPPIRTLADILKRHQRVVTGPAPAPPPIACQRFERAEPNELWQLDFKGWIEIQRARVSPLSILDDHSRFLLALCPCTDLTMSTAWNVLWNVFGEYGLPEAILCDNAFGTHTARRLGVSWFEARLLRLGIRPIHGRPYHPQTQGKVERFHGTLVREVYPRLDTTDLARFTAGLDHWRHGVYNALRPHEALGDQPPVTRWRPSARPRPRELPEVCYPPGSVLRRVGSNGLFHYRSARILAGHGLAGEPVRIEEADGCMVVFYTAKEIRRIPLDRLQQTSIL
jgi:transposase InsO family protein